MDTAIGITIGNTRGNDMRNKKASEDLKSRVHWEECLNFKVVDIRQSPMVGVSFQDRPFEQWE